MKIKYLDFVQQTYDFPQEEFSLDADKLLFHGISMLELVEQYGSPLKFTYLPKISENIQKARTWFQDAMEELDYEGTYTYCYCTKSSHFSFVLEEVLKNNVSLETSHATDLQLIERLAAKGKLDEHKQIVCNGFKTEAYIEGIARLKSKGYHSLISVLDAESELDKLAAALPEGAPMPIGIRIASEEEPKFEFYTSRLGIGYKNILPLYKNKIAGNKKFSLKMLHFFINTGIRDTAYYWNELLKCLNVYVQLKRMCPELTSFNIGGGFPIKSSLAFDYDYAYIIREIVDQIKRYCDAEGVPVPNIFTEFGSYTVGESGGALFKILGQKKQNDREKWNMINSSFMTNLPDAWALSKRFVLLPLHRWEEEYERVFLGGITCDSDDYYNSEQHVNAIYLPKYSEKKPLYIGFFNTGAYQESLGGFGGYQHCLVPNPKHILIRKNEKGDIETSVFAQEQKPEVFLDLLGY